MKTIKPYIGNVILKWCLFSIFSVLTFKISYFLKGFSFHRPIDLIVAIILIISVTMIMNFFVAVKRSDTSIIILSVFFGFLERSIDSGFIHLHISFLSFLIIILLGLMFYDIFVTNNTFYIISPNEVGIYKKFLFVEKKLISTEKITNFSLERKLVDRIIGTGNIKIETAGTYLPEITFYYVKEHEKIYNTLYKLIKERKSE